MAYGVTSTGFVEKTLAVIKAEIEESEKASLGAGINVLATSVLGQINGIMAGQLRELWEVASAVYGASYPDSASETPLENVAAITGALRLAATESTVTVHCTGTPATSLTAGRVVSTGATDRFESTDGATIAAATAWAQPVAYALGAIVTSDGNIYVCTVAGTSGAPALTGTGDGIVDGVGTLRWNFVGDGTGYAAVAFQAEETGEVACDAGAVHTNDGTGDIETPVAGWDDARNLTDASVGRVIETDAAFRLRREQLLAAAGAAAVNAIRSDVLGVTGVAEAFVFHNTTLLTDADGVPAKSFEAVFSATAVNAGVKGGLASANAEPYVMINDQTLLVDVDLAGAPQTVVFTDVDPEIAAIGAVTAAEAAAAINALPLVGGTARAVTVQGQTYVHIESDTTGISSAIEITGGTETVLGFPETPVIAHGVDTAVANAVFESGGAGIEPHGVIKVRVVDDQGSEHLVGVTNPTEEIVEIQLTVTTDDDYPSDGDTQLKAALVALGDNLTIGEDVIYERLQAEVFSISGVTDVTLFNIRFTGDAWGVINLVVGARELATFDTGDVTIV